MITEEAMVDEFILQASHPEEYVREVPLFAKSIDLVRIDKNMTQITAIEFKRKDWKKVILQALGSATVFDCIEICVLKPVTKKCQQRIIEECKRNGIGLYFLDEKIKEICYVLRAIRRDRIWEGQRHQIIKYLRNRSKRK